MKKFITAVLIFSLMLICISGCKNNSPNDEELISETVQAYLAAFFNFSFETYDIHAGMEYWEEAAGEDLLQDPQKLPSLAKSIKENEISRKVLAMFVDEIKIDGYSAVVSAVVQAESASTNPAFNGNLQSEETITLNKIDGKWLIIERTAQVMIMQAEPE